MKFLEHPDLAGYTIEENMIPVESNVRIRCIGIHINSVEPRVPVLFVPGWITQIEAWEVVILEMIKNYDVYYLETREKISSQVQGNTEYSLRAIGRDIQAAVDYFKLSNKNYLLFGSSLGATAILDTCSRAVVKPKTLILVAPNAVFRVPLYWRFIVRVFYPGFYMILKPVIKWYLKNFRLNIELDYQQYQKYSQALDAADPWKLKKAVLAFASYTVWDCLPYIDIPTLLIGASEDKLHEPENLKKIHEQLPNARYLDLGSNKNTHSIRVVEEMDRFLENELMDY